jgi:hypothetical protein
MSLTTATTTATTTAKKTLPAKHNSLLVFGYWLLQEFHADDLIPQSAVDEFSHRFHVFGSVESQIEVLDNFLESFKIIHKNLKKNIRQQHTVARKAAKVSSDVPVVTPKKRGRKKKIIQDTRTEEEILMDEIIASAQTSV